MPAGAVIGGLAAATSAGLGIAGAAGAFDPDAPQGVNYGALTRDAQQAQIDLLGPKLRARQEFDPQSQALQLQLAKQNLLGSPGGGARYYTDQEAVAPEYSYTPRTAGGWGGGGGLAPQGYEADPSDPTRWRRLIQPGYTRAVTRTAYDAPVEGQLDIFEQAAPRINALVNQSQRTAAQGKLDTVRDLGPQALAALRAYDPQATSIDDMLAGQIQSELANPGYLSPDELRDIVQAERSRQSGRGFGLGPNDIFTEALSLSKQRTGRRDAVQAKASQYLNQRKGLYGDPFLTIAGTPGRDPGNPASIVNPYPSLLEDGSAYQGNAANVGIFNSQQANQANIAGYNSRVAGLGSVASGLGKAGGFLANNGEALANWYNTGIFSSGERGSLGGW